MKTLFIEAKKNSSLNLRKIRESLKILPKTIEIAYSIQYREIALQIADSLKKTHKIEGIYQVLGCSPIIPKKNSKAILLIGSGRFHAINLSLQTNLPIYILENESVHKIDEKEAEGLKQKKKASFLKFLHSKYIGILVSTKPGQENLKRSLALKSKLEKKYPEKKFYLFLGNEISVSEFENFPIESRINSACPRLDLDSRVINIGEVEGMK